MDSICLRFEDDQHDPKRALTAYYHLRNKRKPDAMIAFGFFFPTVVGREIRADRVPLINLSLFAKPAVGNPYIIRSMNHTKQYGAALAEFLAKEQQLDFPVVRTEYDFFLHLVGDTAERLRQLKPSAKLSVVAEVLPTDSDFRSIISRLKSAKAERVGVFLFPDQLATFMKQARENNLEFQIFGADICETAAAINGARPCLEGCVYPDNEVSYEFRGAYRARFGNESQLTFAVVAYDMSMLVADYLGKHPTNTPQQLVSRLGEVQGSKGVLGEFTFRDDPEFGKFYESPVAIKKIVNGVGVVVLH
jgi:ABC-type branched-subunit amino acid transport system substrate-binding protein